MSLDTVVADIREEAQARAEELRESAETRADRIIADAEDDAEAIRETAEREVDREIDQLRERRLSSAQLEAKQERLEARRDVLDEVRAAVEDELAGLDGDTRESLTRTLLSAASVEFETDESVSVYGRAADHELLESILEEYDGWSVAGERDCLGGVVVESETSRIRVNNTFDSILEDVWEENLREISDRLFTQ